MSLIEDFKHMKWLPLAGGALLCVLGLTALVWPGRVAKILPLCIGAAILGLGLCEVASGFLAKSFLPEYIPGMRKLQGFVNVAVGLVFLLNRTLSLMFIAVVLGVPMDAMLAYGIVVAGLFASMACATMFSIQAISFVQLETPGHLVGKVIALTMSLANCAQPVGQLIYGGLFDALRGNLVPVALGTAAIAFVIGLVTFRVLRKGLAELQAAVPGAADAR